MGHHMHNIPAIFFHRGNSNGRFAIQQALQYNRRVILLGDETSKLPIGEYHAYQDHDEGALQFVGVFQHMNTAPNPSHDLHCFLRWFFIFNLMKEQQFQRVFAGDTDVLLYADVTEIADEWGDHEILLSVPVRQDNYRWAVAGTSSYWSYNGLRLFLDFLFQLYTTPTRLQQLQEKWHWHQRTGAPGGVCDMTALYLFHQEYPELIGSLISVTGSPPHAFDLSINAAENCYPDEYKVHRPSMAPYGQFKQLEWIDQQPYGYNLRLQQLVRFDGVHFQGGAKCIIPDCLKMRQSDG